MLFGMASSGGHSLWWLQQTKQPGTPSSQKLINYVIDAFEWFLSAATHSIWQMMSWCSFPFLMKNHWYWLNLASNSYGNIAHRKRCSNSSRTRATTPLKHCSCALRASCLAQQTADAEYHIHWSRHLLACIRDNTAPQCQSGRVQSTLPSLCLPVCRR